MNAQRLRTLTTGILHTKIADVCEDICVLVGEPGLMTHQIPAAMKAIEPWLRLKLPDERFFNGLHDPDHVGDYNIDPMSRDEREEFWKRYKAEPSPLSRVF